MGEAWKEVDKGHRLTDLESFYNELADDYALIYADWEASLKLQAQDLDAVFRAYGDGPVKTVLDAACGIGTQAIGLAELGYQVTASDISQASIDRAAAETQRRGLKVEYTRADMRSVDDSVEARYDAVIACDNAVPHLLTDADLLAAFQAFYRCLRPGGLVAISTRDYSDMPREGHRIYPRRVHTQGRRKIILFDVWAFDGDHYDLTLYRVDDPGEGHPKVRAVRGGRYYCVPLDQLQSLMGQAGFVDVSLLQDAYFQPLIVGRR
jgi:SAM-dependent methyltransferase